MTMAQFAIARKFAQLLAAADTRVLSVRETELLELLEPIVERYEQEPEGRTAKGATL